MSSPFPLLRLPRLVLCEVFKLLSIGEKIKLSLCSKKISAQINNTRLYSQKVVVDLDLLSQNIKVYSETYKDAYEIFIRSGTISDPYIQHYQIEGHTVPVISFTKRITTFWKNHREGFLSVIRYLLKIFHCKISTNYTFNNLYQSIISELFDLQLEFKKLTIKLEGSEDQKLLWNQISNKFGLVEDLIISSFHDPDFTPVFTSWPQKIDIRSSAWSTLKFLLTCTCTRITLWYSHLHNEDLDVILKKWKTGGFPNLESLRVDSRNITSTGANILGMTLRELDGIVIQTDDGSKKATIRTGSRCIEMSITSFE